MTKSKILFIGILCLTFLAGCSLLKQQVDDIVFPVEGLSPQNVAGQAGRGIVVLNWDPLELSLPGNTIQAYEISRRLDSESDFTLIATVAHTSTQYFDRVVTPGITYIYTIRGVDNVGRKSQMSTEIQLTPIIDTDPPITPQGLTVTAHHDTITISWSANTEIDLAGYDLWFRTQDIPTFSRLVRLNGVLQYRHRNLTFGSTYFYQIQARDFSDNVSNLSSSESETPTPDETPPAQVAIDTTIAGNAQIQISWPAPTENDITGYLVFRSVTETEGFALVATLGNQTTFQDSGLDNGTTYYYQVVAVDEAGNQSVVSDTISITPEQDGTPPLPPTQLKAEITPTSVHLYWEPSPDPDVVGYIVYQTLTSGENYQEVTQVFGTTSAEVPNLAPGIPYIFVVQAVDSSGNTSPVSAELTESPGPDINPPSAPQSGEANNGDNSVTLTWDPSPEPDVSSYTVTRTPASSASDPSDPTTVVPDPNAIPETIATVPGDDTEFTDGSANNGTVWIYEVTPVDTAGNSGDPIVLVGQPEEDTTPPSPPINVSATTISTPPPSGASGTSGSGTSDGTTSGSDTGGSGSTSGTDSTGSGSSGTSGSDTSGDATGSTDTGGSGSTSGTDSTESGSSGSTTGSSDTGGSGSTSGTVSGGTDTGGIGTGGTSGGTGYVGDVGDVDVDGIVVTWDLDPDEIGEIAGIRVYRKDDSVIIFVGALPPDQFIFVDTTVATGLTYTFCVTTVDFSGNESEFSDPIIITATPDLTPPDPPQIVQGTPGLSSVTIGWISFELPQSLSHFNLYQSPTSGGSYSLLVSPGAFETETTVTNLPPNVLGYYVLTAVDHSGYESVYSNEIALSPIQDTFPPPIPTGFSVVTGNTFTVLNWSEVPDDAGDLDGIAVVRKIDPDLDFSTVVSLNATATEYVDENLTNGVAHTYSIRSFDMSGNLSNLAPALTVIPTPNMLPPQNFSGVTGDRKVTLTWSTSNDTKVVQYQLVRSLTSGTEFSHLEFLSKSTSQFIDTNLTNDTTYFYKIQSLDAQGLTSQLSPEISLKPEPDRTPPPVPVLNSPLTGHIHFGITISWNAVSDVDGDFSHYAIYRQTDAETSLSELATTTATTYTDPNLTPGTTYTYALKSVDDSDNQSAFSNTESIEPEPDSIPPEVPVFSQLIAGNEAIKLNWAAIANSHGDFSTYRVFKSTSASGPFTQLGSATDTTFTDTGLTNGVTLFYTIASEDSFGNVSAQSSVSSATPSLLGAPTNLNGTGGHEWVQLTWTAGSEAGLDGYVVFRQGPTDPDFVEVATTNGTTYRNLGLTNGTAYQFTIRAFDFTNSRSDPATAISVAPVEDVIPPQIPSGVVANPAFERINLVWQSVSDEDIGLYRVYRSLAQGGPYTEIGTTSASDNFYEDSGLTNGTPYYYQITAEDVVGNESLPSNTVSGTPVQQDEIQHFGEGEGIFISSDGFRFQWEGEEFIDGDFFLGGPVLRPAWHVINQVKITLTAPTTGWVGVGISQQNTGLSDAEVVVGFISGGQVQINDYYGTGTNSFALDTDNGGSDDITDKSGSESNGTTTISFKIQTQVSSQTDRVINIPGTNYVTIMYGSSDNPNAAPVSIRTVELRL